MSSTVKVLARVGCLLATVVALSDKPSASSLAATTSATHDANVKTKGTIVIHDAQNNEQIPPTGTSHEPTAHVELHVEHTGCSSDDVELNLGLRSSPEACAAAVLGHGACDRSFMFAPSHKEWGCRCCIREDGDESNYRQESFAGSPAWNLYVAGIAAAEAEAVQSPVVWVAEAEAVESPVVWVAPNACGCNACPCVVVAEPPAPELTAWAATLAEPPAPELTAWAATQSVNAAVWHAEIDSLATTVSRAAAGASRSSAEARLAEQAARQAQADAAAAATAAEAASSPAQESQEEVASSPCTACGEAPAAVDAASLEEFGRQVGTEVGAATQAYPGDGYAPALAAGDGVAQSADAFAAVAALN